MKSKIFFLLIFFCLLSMPASAWEMTFEEHPNDLDPDGVISSSGAGGLTTAIGHGTWYYGGTSGETTTIEKTYTGNLAFNFKNSEATNLEIKLYNSTGYCVWDVEKAITENTPTVCRIELVESITGNAIDVYRNGVFRDSHVYLVGDPDTITTIKLRAHASSSTPTHYYDDFSSNYGGVVVGCDAGSAYTNNYQYFTLSYPTTLTGTVGWYYKIYDPDGDLVTTSADLTGIGEKSISTELLTESGTYDIQLYCYDTENNDYLMGSRTFEHELLNLASMSLTTSEVEPGESVRVFVNGASGYILQCDPPGSNNLQSHTISTSSGYISFPIPSSCVAGKGAVYLRTPSGTRIDYDYFEVIGGTGADASGIFGADAYTNTDQLDFWYNDLPAGSIIVIRGNLHGETVFEIQSEKSGTGILYYTLTGQGIDGVTSYISYDGEIIARDYAKIAYGADYVCYGVVYDAATGATIDGASVNIGGMVNYATMGHYSVGARAAGINTYYVSADGYTPLSGNVTLATLTTQKDFYMTSTSLAGGSAAIYGVTSDAATGIAISSAYISITNGTASYQALGRTNTGYYLFDGLPDNSTWTMTATKTGYDNYQTEVTISGSTFQLIQLVPTGYGAPTTPTTPTDGGSSTSTTTDRPGRTAARSTMEEFETSMPAVLGLIPFVLIFKLLGEF